MFMFRVSNCFVLLQTDLCCLSVVPAFFPSLIPLFIFLVSLSLFILELYPYSLNLSNLRFALPLPFYTCRPVHGDLLF